MGFRDQPFYAYNRAFLYGTRRAVLAKRSAQLLGVRIFLAFRAVGVCQGSRKLLAGRLVSGGSEVSPVVVMWSVCVFGLILASG